nr:hypothetical protein CFP56_03262 [Quercus suber]
MLDWKPYEVMDGYWVGGGVAACWSVWPGTWRSLWTASVEVSRTSSMEWWPYSIASSSSTGSAMAAPLRSCACGNCGLPGSFTTIMAVAEAAAATRQDAVANFIVA